MPLFGAHLSVAGGYLNALLSAQEHGCGTVQLFTKQPNQWAAKAIDDDQATTFRDTRQRIGLRKILAHDSYLINLASPDTALYRRSLDAFVAELERAEKLGLDYLVMHPGAHVDSGEEAGLLRVAKALDEAHARCAGFGVRVLIETTAGQGSTLGHRFEHLAAILGAVADPDRLGVCLDTCHVFAAGYALAPEKQYRATLKEFDRIVGLDRIEAFHVNDSLKPLGSRVDRHAHIGKGELGLEPFRLLVNDARFRDHPMVVEMPPESVGDDLEALRGLLKEGERTPPPSPLPEAERGSKTEAPLPPAPSPKRRGGGRGKRSASS
jgi:deoxyribonuclease-4